MSRPSPITRGLASAFLAGGWDRVELLQRGTSALGFGGQWLRELVNDVLAAFPSPPRHARDGLAAFIEKHPRNADLHRRRELPGTLRRWFADAPHMAPARWPVRELHTLRDVAHWLGLEDAQLEWFADRRGLEHWARDVRLQHYRYRWVAKPDGGARLLEVPKQRLKALQRKVLRDVLDVVPAHEAAHGFRRGRSVLTHAQRHANQDVVLRFDLEAFFAHVPMGRALGVFMRCGYPEEVAKSLAGLCTNVVPLSVLKAAPAAKSPHALEARFRLRQALSVWHLAQGAPTSPALANLAAFELDVRLTELGQRFGATYTRYADDLTFSGDQSLAGGARRLLPLVEEIARDEGFWINRAKTRVMTQARQQRVTGIVVNAGVNVARREYDQLKATLHRCRTRGPVSQPLPVAELRQHLLGRISWVEQLNPARGTRLRQMFDAVNWSA